MCASSRSPLPPPDDRLPAAATLLDADMMTDHLGEICGRRLDGGRVRYVEYVPGASLVVQYDAVDPAGGPRIEAHALATAAGWRTWVYPDDPLLPLLAAGPSELAHRLHVPVGHVTRLAWVPQRRAVLRCGDVVIKLYADRADADRAERALRAVDGVVPTARLIGSTIESGAVVQEAIDGRPLGRDGARAAAGGAAGVLRMLHGASIPDLHVVGPGDVLAAAAAPSALASFVVPDLASRLASATERLAATMPEVIDPVPVHGDFNVGQLLVDGDRTMVVDVDTLAQGSASVDVAAYAANLHNGRDGDEAEMRATLRAVIDAYGIAVDDIEWYLATALLRRVDRPFRRLKKRWRQRTAALVAAIEAVLA